MNEYIKSQLNTSKIAQIPPFNDDTTEIVIPKLSNVILRENKYYLIELDDILITPNQSALTINWNNGSIPKSKYYQVDVLKKMGSMVKINGVAFDKNINQSTNELWCGWLPISNVKVLEEI